MILIALAVSDLVHFLFLMIYFISIEKDANFILKNRAIKKMKNLKSRKKSFSTSNRISNFTIKYRKSVKKEQKSISKVLLLLLKVKICRVKQLSIKIIHEKKNEKC